MIIDVPDSETSNQNDHCLASHSNELVYLNFRFTNSQKQREYARMTLYNKNLKHVKSF